MKADGTEVKYSLTETVFKKSITPLPEENRIAELKELYNILNSKDAPVSLAKVKAHETSTSFKLSITPVGSQRQPVNETELLEAVKYDIFLTLRSNSSTDSTSVSRALHHGLVWLHKKGWIHGDIRWPNVLVGSQGWFLVDFENASKSGDAGADWGQLGKMITNWSLWGSESQELSTFVNERLLLKTSSHREPMKSVRSDAWLFQ